MADIDLERKSGGGMGWLWWAVGLLLLVLIVWWVWPEGDEPEAEFADVETTEAVETTEPVTPAATPQPVADIPGVSVGDILGNPDNHIGDTFPRAEVTAVEVPTDRGFWIEDEGERLFAIIIDRPEEQPKDINPGATLRIDGGTLRDRTFLPEIPGEPLDPTTERMAEQQDIFLVVDEAEITVLEGGQPQPGTDPAQAVQPNQ